MQEPAGRLVESNQLKLNTSKSKEMVLDLDRSEPHQQPCTSKGGVGGVGRGGGNL